MKRLLFDAETDGLLDTCTRMWILTAIDIDTGRLQTFLEGDLGWRALIDNCEIVVGHNVIGFDFAMLRKLFGYVRPRHVRVHDTMIMSQVLDYKRFGGRHSMEAWGEHLGVAKVEHEDWSQYSPEMRNRNISDVKLNVMMYKALVDEMNILLAKMEKNGDDPNKLITYLRAETAVAEWSARAAVHGWPFDLDGAKKLQAQLEIEMNNAYTALSNRLGTKVVAVDKSKGVYHTKKPKWVKSGAYDSHTANWFDVHPFTGLEGEERMIEGEYTRIEIVPLSLDSVSDVKIFLNRNGWIPTEWNYGYNEQGKKVKKSPKITDDSLEFLGGDGQLYSKFLTAKARHSIIETWIKNTDKDGMLHGDIMTIGTPSMRARHSVIANVPTGDSPWGKEMRSLFGCLPGWKFIGADSAGNQARGLAHYLGDRDFIHTLLHGDIHQFNADTATAVLHKMQEDDIRKAFRDGERVDLFMAADFKVTRSQAKRILYAFLFGASGSKLWSYIFGTLDDDLGRRFKAGFTKAVPGFKQLIEKLENIYGKTSQYGDGYIPSIAGNRIYVDSFHKLLVYLLQSLEKITCSTAVLFTMENLDDAGIPYIPLIFYHDELDFMVPEEYAEKAAEISKNSFRDAPKKYGVEIMDGGVKIGDDWFQCH